ncbi:hypothetical protein V1478_006006 [Vespula squamosa]|uniref:Uncharacterized protein n=1 Tax=Vespula squamosa TaxID=30214 RepID=A0ABD2B928_VESSQ
MLNRKFLDGLPRSSNTDMDTDMDIEIFSMRNCATANTTRNNAEKLAWLREEISLNAIPCQVKKGKRRILPFEEILKEGVK